MTPRFVDVAAGAGSTYDPATRLLGSGSFNNYIDLQAAQSASVAGDTIYMRSGTEAPRGVTTVNVAVKIRSYVDEIHTIPVTGSAHGLTCSVVAPNIDCGKGQLVIG